MAAKTDIVVTGLDFDTIRGNLRNYVASKPEFTDYDLDDSAIGTLLDLLAYNTYYNAFYVNMATNESFIDTAQQYDSVVSHAKKLGYTPTSARGSSANIQLTFTMSQSNGVFRSIRVPKNTRFSAIVNNSLYNFVTPQTYTITANSSGGFADYIRIVEGQPLTHRYVYNRTSNTAFILPNDNVDTSSISVTVTSSGNVQPYILVDDVFSVNSSSQVFYTEADRQQRYKVYFGDGIFGKQPPTNSIVAIDYRVCSGSAPNGANSFSIVNPTIDGQSSIRVTSIGRSSGGAEIEGIESVRFNAPRGYETQNRSVTAPDYERILLRDNPDIQAISVWGGEENDPPIYGKVFVCAKPKSGILFSKNRKDDIRNSIRKYNVQSIDTQIVDPTYMYIVPYVDVRYNMNATSLTPGELATVVADSIIAFEESYLSTFSKSFRFSRFLSYIDGGNDSFQTTTAHIRLKKLFTPSTLMLGTYTLKFNCAIQRLGDKNGAGSSVAYGCLTSSPFVYGGQECFFDDNGYGRIRAYYKSAAATLGRVYVISNAGTIDYDTGVVTINNFLPTSFENSGISIIVAPVEVNVQPIRNQILLISQSHVNIIDDKTGKVLASASNIDTTGQTATILTPTAKLYSY